MPELRVRRDDPGKCALVDVPPPDDLVDGEALLLVERFALTTNNITYALLGDRLGYWRLFPTDDAWGRVPAWGNCRVVSSRSPALAADERFFGLVPMGPHLTVRPVGLSAGFTDSTPHRAGLSPVYNGYLPATGADSDVALVMRPLFGTSVVLDLVLAGSGFSGADTVVLTSASSKTGYGLAYLLRDRPVTVIGLTTTSRRPWVAGLNLYDAVRGYDELDSLAAPGGALLVDFAGDPGLLRGIHRRLGRALLRSILVGFTHRQPQPSAEALPGPVPEFFFAPDEMVRRRRELSLRYPEAWRGFAPVADASMRIVTISDGEQLLRTYRDLYAGRIDPAIGHVVHWPR
jgi:hypothetical protein